MKTPGFVLIFFCAAVFLAGGGCAATKEKRPALEDRAVDAAIRGAEAFSGRDYQGALERFERSLQLDRSIDNRAGEIVDLINIARVYVALGDYRSAEDRVKKAVALAVQSNDAGKLSEARATHSKIRWMAGDAAAALEEIDLALSADLKAGVKSGARMNLKGQILVGSGRVDDAEGVLQAALSINKDEKNAVETANSCRALGRVNEIKKNWNGALGFYSSAYDADRIAGDPVKIAGDLMGMAESNLVLRRLDEAAFLFGRAYTVSANGGLGASMMESLDKLVLTYREMGNAEKADFYSRVRDALSTDNGAAGGRVK